MLLGGEDAGPHGHGPERAAVARELFRCLSNLRVVFGLADDLTSASRDLTPTFGRGARPRTILRDAGGDSERAGKRQRRKDAVHDVLHYDE